MTIVMFSGVIWQFLSPHHIVQKSHAIMDSRNKEIICFPLYVD